ncbi:MAG: hypothetical protein L7F78_05210 [Syntrophales bacterium LBB04]|nr:hypothetical protein [Syntrophales bacterium LBB04]
MTETVIKYTLPDKNKVKIDNIVNSVLTTVDNWLIKKPTGQILLTVEINANQGGVGDVYIEKKERRRV